MKDSVRISLALLVKYFFREYAVAKNLASDQLDQIQLQQFVPWTRQRLQLLLNAPSYIEIGQEWTKVYASLGEHPDVSAAIEVLEEALNDPYNATLLLSQFWNYLVLGSRETPKVPVSSLGFTFTISYLDGSQLPIAMSIPAGEKPMRDADVVIHLEHACQMTLSMIKQHGLDALRERLSFRPTLLRQQVSTPDSGAAVTQPPID